MQQRKTTRLEDTLTEALKRRRSQSTLRLLTKNPPNSVDFSSNDFLSLASSQELRQIFLSELQSGPALSSLGSGGSRLLDGNSQYAEQLENDIATFHGAKSGLLCNSGFDANVGLFSCLAQLGDIIVYDEYIHASVHDGMRLSRARECIPFTHNSVSALQDVLEHLNAKDELVHQGRRNVFVAVESIYSMDGDVAPLVNIVRTVRSLLPNGNGHLIVDEAHSTGVLGPRGRGLVSLLGLEKEFLVRLHTFGKALACNGAILLCDPLVRQYLVNYSRPLIYTTFMSYPALSAIRASYRLLMTGKTEPLAKKLQDLIKMFHGQMWDMQTSLCLPQAREHLLRSPKTCPETPIFAVLTSEPKALAAHCQNHGFVVRGIVAPTVPEGTERIRVCLHSGNTIKQIGALTEVIRFWVEKRLRELEAVQDVRPRL